MQGDVLCDNTGSTCACAASPPAGWPEWSLQTAAPTQLPVPVVHASLPVQAQSPTSWSFLAAWAIHCQCQDDELGRGWFQEAQPLLMPSILPRAQDDLTGLTFCLNGPDALPAGTGDVPCTTVHQMEPYL